MTTGVNDTDPNPPKNEGKKQLQTLDPNQEECAHVLNRRQFTKETYENLLIRVSASLFLLGCFCYVILQLEGDPSTHEHPFGISSLRWADTPGTFPHKWVAAAPLTIIITTVIWIVFAEDYQQKSINLAALAIFCVCFGHYIFMHFESGLALNWNGRHFTPFRYLEWSLGLPMMKYLSILQKTPDVGKYMEFVLVDISMVVTGLLAELQQPSLGFWVFVILSFAFYVRSLQLFFRLVDSLPHVDYMKTVFKVSFILGSGIFPFNWVMAYIGNFDEFTECCVYVSGDICSKIALNSAFRVAHMNQVLQEVSAKHEAERLARARIEADAAKRREFMNYIFHEVRVPINGLSMGVDMLKLILSKPEYNAVTERREETESITVIDDGLVHVTKVLNDILNLEKADQGRLQLDEAPFVLHASLKRVLGVYKASALQRKIQISMPMEKLPMVVGDKYRLKQIISNFVSNALKFTPPGGKIKVKVSLLHNHYMDVPFTFPPIYEGKEAKEKLLHEEFQAGLRKWVRIGVADSGIGLSEDAQKMMFKPYTQIAPGKNQQGGGTGLGLAICQKFVEFMHGHIGVKSNQGKGSEFFIILPYKFSKAHVNVADYAKKSSHTEKEKKPKAFKKSGKISLASEIEHTPSELSDPHTSDYERASQEPPIPIPEPDDVASRDRNGGGNRRKRLRRELPGSAATKIESILVVDDTLSNRNLLQKILQSHGFRVETASNGKECVEKVYSGAVFDYIVMDQEMPEMNGPEAARKLREGGWKNPIIGVSGNWMQEKQDEMYAAGFDWVMLKPFNLKKFLEYVGRDRFTKQAKTTHKPIFLPNKDASQGYKPPSTIQINDSQLDPRSQKRSRFGPRFKDLLESSEGSSASEAPTPEVRHRRLLGKKKREEEGEILDSPGRKLPKLSDSSGVDVTSDMNTK